MSQVIRVRLTRAGRPVDNLPARSEYSKFPWGAATVAAGHGASQESAHLQGTDERLERGLVSRARERFFVARWEDTWSHHEEDSAAFSAVSIIFSTAIRSWSSDRESPAVSSCTAPST